MLVFCPRQNSSIYKDLNVFPLKKNIKKTLRFPLFGFQVGLANNCKVPVGVNLPRFQSVHHLSDRTVT